MHHRCLPAPYMPLHKAVRKKSVLASQSIALQLEGQFPYLDDLCEHAYPFAS